MEYDISLDILRVIHGSNAYGTNIASSDVDIKGVFIPTREYLLSPFKSIEQFEQKNADTVIYTLSKFFKLAADCNPNIIEILFVHHDDILFINNIGIYLINNNNLFLSKKAKHTFTGYAHSQLKRLKNHKRWIDNPPKKPNKNDYAINTDDELTNTIVGQIDKDIDIPKSQMPNDETIKDLESKWHKSVVEKYLITKQYNNACYEWEQYNNCKNNRNKDRFALEFKYGYDTKHAMHLIRLLRMGVEILTEGKVYVKRHDAKELLSIRDGKWSFDKLIEEAYKLDEECNRLYNISMLPNKPNINKLEELYFILLDMNGYKYV